MRKNLFLFALGVLVGLSLLQGIAEISERITRAGNGPTQLMGGYVLPAVVENPATQPPASSAAFDGTEQLDVTDGLAGAIGAAVRVLTESAAGSGVVIDPAGLVLTSAHVVGESREAAVFTEDGRHLVGAVLKTDVRRDLALLSLPKGTYESALLGSIDNLALGAPLYVVGYPLNMAGPATVTKGVVSRYVEDSDLDREVIQTDASTNLGSSGGPVLDEGGRVIGIVASILGDYPSRPTSGISFAVSIATVREHLLK